MIQTIRNTTRLFAPNISRLKKIDAKGDFVALQKRPTRASAAHIPGSRPKRLPKVHPKVAPMQNTGTISPPLKPAARVTAVKISFNMKSKYDLILKSNAVYR